MAVPEEIADAHHHLWNPVTNDPNIGYVWLKDIGAPKPFGDPTPIQRDYLLAEFLSEPLPARIAASVHLQADGGIPDPVAETRFVDKLAQEAGHQLAIVGFADLSRKDAIETIKRHLEASGMFRGVRQILSRLEDRPDISFAATDHLADARWREQFCRLAEFGLSFDLQCYPEQMPAVAEFLAGHPDVPVIIDHAGSAWDLGKDGLKRWQNGLNLLATLPWISIKMCGFGMFDRNWNAETTRPQFETVTELFGPHRMLFASNFPVDRLMRSYPAILADMDRLTAQWSDEARSGFFLENTKRIYRI